jgi:hypothetical protein
MLYMRQPELAHQPVRIVNESEQLGVIGGQISMDGRGRYMDNIFIERLWRSLKHEDVCLKHYSDGREAREGIASWIAFYNGRRPLATARFVADLERVLGRPIARRAPGRKPGLPDSARPWLL